MKNFARKWILPPGINQLLADAPPSLKRVRGGQSLKPEGIEQPEGIELRPSENKAASLKDLLVAPYGKIVWVETEKIRVWGRAFTRQQHQYVRYFEDGFGKFSRFFELHKPRNQFETLLFTDMSVDEFVSVSPPRDQQPWSSVGNWDPAPLSAEFRFRGPKMHGPIASELLEAERVRLDAIRDSVERNGFLFMDSDFIFFGEILVDDSKEGVENFRILLAEGHHRVALLAHLGWPIIPMMPAHWIPLREVRLSDHARWPGVLDGTFSEQAARAYFLAHFRNPTEELLPGW